MMPTKSQLLRHAQDYREQAANILTCNPAWVSGDPKDRAVEKLELAAYFENLASK